MTRLAVVTGGGTGIGRAVAWRLAQAGDEVVLIGRRSSILADTAQEINAGLDCGLVRWITADLTEPAQVETLAKEITGGGREVAVLVNNAGGNYVPQPSTDLDGVRRDWLTNLTGNILPVVLVTAALLPALTRPGGRIVTISSVAALRGPASYGGAKAALHPWSIELATRLAPEGITVNVVAPGYVVDTEFYGGRMSPVFHQSRAQLAPMRRGGIPDEIAATVAHLASPVTGFLTGQVIHINGGQLMGRS